MVSARKKFSKYSIEEAQIILKVEMHALILDKQQEGDILKLSMFQIKGLIASSS